MIQYLTRKELDTKKYDECIFNAFNSRIYAFSWYLDIVADNWDVLILDDYEAVMPLPWRKKYLIRYVYLTPWVQQLGLFTLNEIENDIADDFINAIPKKFKLIEMFLNSQNHLISNKMTVRNNYILMLKEPYDNIYKNYKKGRKSDIKVAQKAEIILQEVNNPSKTIELFRNIKSKEIDREESDYQILKSLVKKLTELDKVKIYEAYDSKNEFLGGAFFIIDNFRITYLFSAVNEEGRNKNVISLIINSMIKEFSNSNLIFDFEGSMIDSLASFFKSFGSEEEKYYFFRLSRLPKFIGHFAS